MALFVNMSSLVVLVVFSAVLVSSQACIPNCSNVTLNNCGPDGCGGSCGTCASNEVCQPFSFNGASGFNYVCQTVDGNCSPFTFAYDDRVSQPPSKNSELAYCKQYSSKTCCSQGYSQTRLPAANPISCLYAKLGSACNNLFLLYSCVACHPQIGTGALTIIPCKSFCDKVWNTCKGSKMISADFEANETLILPVGSGGKSISDLFGTEEAFFLALTSNSTTTEAIFPDPLQGCQYYYDSNPNNDPDQSTCFSGENRLVSSVLVSALLLMMLSLRAM